MFDLFKIAMAIAPFIIWYYLGFWVMIGIFAILGFICFLPDRRYNKGDMDWELNRDYDDPRNDR